MRKIKLALLSVAALGMVFAASCSLESGIPEQSSLTSGTLEMSETPETSETPDTPEEKDEWAEYNTITVARALEICQEVGETGTTERYYLRGTVKDLNATYGEMTLVDETGEIYVYGTYSADGSKRFSELEETPKNGDEVLLHCILKVHSGKKEVGNARLIDFKKVEISVDESDYTEMNLADARTAAEGTLIKTDGVVAKITYAFGMKPSGVYLVDETQSIYVYDANLAATAKVGNQVSILASKTWWVLDSEQANAQKFGYKGCCQLENVTVLSNDKGSHEFNKTWITETTVKDIMETPVTTDITTTIYKVNAYVKESVGTGFTNYYIDDIDGKTGSYVYTQCNGSDLAWLKEFDGKICTVYLSVINAKSTATGCQFRFMPISVSYDNYTFDAAKAPDFALEYYALDQFEESYTGDPALEVVTSVSSEILSLDNITISYTSDNTNSVYFTTADGKTVMHCGENGTANVTVTATYGQVSKSATVKITKKSPVVYQSITVAQAIAAAVDSEVTVKGIVGPSLVNQSGFYLFGEDGSMIAVKVFDQTQFNGLSIGHEVVLKGRRERYVKDDASTIAGQTCIVEGEILVNNGGEHEYSTAKFTEKTIAEFNEMDIAEDYSTSVFIIKATVEYVENAYYTSLNLKSNGATLKLYMSGAGQYSWLKAFSGQEITMEVAACNWNDKTDVWRGCVLAARTASGKILNTLNFN